MSFPLFRALVKNNWVLFVVFTTIMLLYLIMILSMYNEDMLTAMEASLSMIPSELAAAVGMEKIPTDLTDFAANYFYGFLIQLFILVHVILLPLRLVVKYVDDGSMSYLLSTPNSRLKVVLTQMGYLAVSLLVMMVFVSGVAMIFCHLRFPGELDSGAFLTLNFTAYLMALAMAAITFFFSCLWNEYAKSAGCSAGILVLMFVATLLGRVGHQKGIYGVVGDLSILRFLDGRAIISGQVNMVINDLVLILISLIFLTGGAFVFQRRDLPL